MQTLADTLAAGLLVSGNSNNGVNDGLTYVNANNAPSNANANIGSRRVYTKAKIYNSRADGTDGLTLTKINHGTICQESRALALAKTFQYASFKSHASSFGEHLAKV